MSQIQTSNWSQTAASNNAASPNGMPEAMAPSGVNDSVRELMSALKIDWCNVHGLDASNALLSSAGSGTTRTLTYGTAPATLYTGLIAGFKADTDFDAASTLNVNALGAKNIQKMTSTGYSNIVAGDIIALQHVIVKYDGTLDKWVMLSPVGTASAAGTVTSVATAGLASGGPITGSGTVTVSISAQSDLGAIPATDDYVAIYDTSAAAHRKVAWDTLIPDASTSQEGKVELATAAEMVTGTDAARVPSVSVVKNNPGVAKAWCYVTISGGTPTLAVGYNVSSITDSGAGRFVVNFTTAFSTANYVGICTCAQDQGASVRWIGHDDNAGAQTASAFQVAVVNSAGSYTDPEDWSATFFGTQ